MGKLFTTFFFNNNDNNNNINNDNNNNNNDEESEVYFILSDSCSNKRELLLNVKLYEHFCGFRLTVLTPCHSKVTVIHKGIF